jgi:filamentous hemagglutinin family protein
MLLYRLITQSTPLLSGLLLVYITPWQPAMAQPIIPAADGTQTNVINSAPNQFDIQGGTQSGENLFHSFEQFGLDANQVANFLSNPDIQNILGRVTGGNPSYINGLIQVSGSSANLFLINPAGMIFGENVRLNVPAAFTATTADGIGFGQSGWFNVIGDNNWSELVGNPNGFRFDRPLPGTLINLGQLEVNAGQQLSLIGGRVVSTGKLSAPNGRLWVQAVPGESIIRMSQAGQLLSLDLPASTLSADPQDDANLQLNPIQLPELLTGGDTSAATTVSVNPQGELVLQGNYPIQPGDVAIASQTSSLGIEAGNVILNAAGTLTLAQTQLQTTGNLNLLAGDTIRIRDTVADLSLTAFPQASASNLPGFLATTGGNLTIIGQESIDILALNPPTTTDAAFNVRGDLTFISDGIISGDSHYNTGGNFSLLNTTGGYGTFVSILDPIIRSSGNVFFGNYTGASLKIEAAGGIFGGNISITQPDTSLSNTTDPDASLLRSQPTLILRSGVSGLGILPDLNPEDGFSSSPISGNEISVGEITTNGGPVIIESPGEINFNSIRTNGGNITANGTGNIEVTGILATNGGNIDIATDGTLQVNSSFVDVNGTEASISSASGSGQSGSITINYGNDEDRFVIGDNSQNGTASNITTGSNTLTTVLTVEGSLTQGNITIGIPENSEPPVDEPTLEPPVDEPPVDEPTLEPPVDGPPILPTPIPSIPPFPTPTPTPAPTPSPSPSEEDPEPPDGNDVSSTVTEPIPRSEPQADVNIDVQPTNNQQLLSVDSNTEQLELNSGNSSQQQLTTQTDEQGNVSVVKADSENAVDENSDENSVSENSEVNQAEASTETFEDSSIELARAEVSEVLDSEQVDQSITEIDQFFDFEYTGYFGKNIEKASEISVADIQDTLISIGQQLNSKPAIIYTFVRENQLEILLITGTGERVHKTVPAANKEILSQVISQLFQGIFTSRYRRISRYLPPAQQLYQWMIKPIEAELEQAEIETLLFAMDGGLRSLPIGVLHDGEQFLIEKYSVSLIPSFNLINTRYRSLNDARVLAMGASEFEDQQPLPAVPVELETITSKLPGDFFLNETFTINNFEEQRDERPYQIVHLATHGEFRPGQPSNSYIQFWDSRLTLDRLQQMGWRWNNPPLDLLVLSACRSALGDRQAELGFAGLAVQAGVPSALASLWYVSDQGSLALMTQFYQQLRTASTKAEALRQAQLAMINGEVTIQSGQLFYRSEDNNSVVLPPELVEQHHQDFSHPYYWAGWTIIGSPW